MQRWQQRFDNYKKAFKQFENGVNTYKLRQLSDLEKQGVIQSFEYCFEIGWNLLKDYLNFQGIYEVRGSRDAIRLAFKYGLIDDADVWLDMVSARNLTSHTYDPEILDTVLQEIIDSFYFCLRDLVERFNQIEKEYG